MQTEPRVPRRDQLKNGNPSGDFTKAPRCGARTRRGTSCACPAMKNGRCRLHGGLSTGPRTPEGLERSRRARWKHGFYSQETIAQRTSARHIAQEVRKSLRGIGISDEKREMFRQLGFTETVKAFKSGRVRVVIKRTPHSR